MIPNHIPKIAHETGEILAWHLRSYSPYWYSTGRCFTEPDARTNYAVVEGAILGLSNKNERIRESEYTFLTSELVDPFLTHMGINPSWLHRKLPGWIERLP